jgi:hypothetical protein
MGSPPLSNLDQKVSFFLGSYVSDDIVDHIWITVVFCKGIHQSFIGFGKFPFQ